MYGHFTVAVSSTGQPGGFYTQASPGINAVAQGMRFGFTETVAPIGGGSGTISFSQGTDPNKIQLDFAPVNGIYFLNGNTAINIPIGGTVPADLAPGTYAVAFSVSVAGVIQPSTVFVTVTPAAAPDFTIGPVSGESVHAGKSVSFTALISPRNGFTGMVTMPAGKDDVHHVGISFCAASNAACASPADYAFNISGSAPAAVRGTITTTPDTPVLSYPIIFSAASATITQNSTVQVSVQGGAVPDFGITVAAPGTLPQGGSSLATATLSPISAFTGIVTLSASGLPPGLLVTFNPGTVNMTSGSITRAATITLSAPGLALTPAQTYNFTVTGTSGQLHHSYAASVTVRAPDPFTASITYYPSPGTFFANASGGVGPYSLAWGGVVLGAAPISIATYGHPSSPGSYTATLTVTDSRNVTYLAYYTIVVQAGLSVSISASGAAVAGNPVKLTAMASGGSGGYGYIWLQPAQGTDSGADHSSHTFNVVAGANNTMVLVTDSSGITATGSLVVTATAPLAISPTPQPAAVVKGQPVLFSANPSGGTGVYSYKWTLNGGGTVVGTDPTYLYSTTQATPTGPVVATVTVNDGQSALTMSASVTVSTGVGATLSAAASSVPVNQPLQLNIAVVGGTAPYTYAWTISPATASVTVTAQTSATATAAFTSANSATYTVALVVSDSGGLSSVVQSILVQVVPANATLTLNPSFLSAMCGPGVYTVSLSGNSTWTAAVPTASQGWVTLNGAANGTAPADVSYSIQANATGSLRTGTITFTDTVTGTAQDFTVSQGSSRPREYIRLGGRVVAIEPGGCISQ